MNTIEYYQSHPLITFNDCPVCIRDLNHQLIAANQSFSSLRGILLDALNEHHLIVCNDEGDIAGSMTIHDPNTHVVHLNRLTKMEHQVLSCFATGMKRKNIAEQCRISTSTYDFHIKNLKKKLKAATTHDLFVLSAQYGLLINTTSYN